MANRRVVVTGLGAVSSLGNNVEDTWQSLLAGKSGVSQLPDVMFGLESDTLATKFAAQLKNFDRETGLPPKFVKIGRKVDDFVLLSAAVTKQALEDAGINEISDEESFRFGTAIGSGIGGLNWITTAFEKLFVDGKPQSKKISPFFIPGAIINMAPGLASLAFNLRGPNISIVTACTTGAHNIGQAARMIQYGDADVMVAGGSELATGFLCVGGFNAARALSKRNDEPQKASRPFDRDRDGFVVGEGAGALILEEYEHAKKRGAKIYAELVGFGMSADAYHMTGPDPEGTGMMMSMKNCLNDAKVDPTKINYVNPHATSTPLGDKIETLAVKRTFGEHANKLAISATKSMTGHMLGAAGAVEAIFSILAIRDNVVPPTINLDNPGEGCDLDYVPHVKREMQVDYALSNSFGFGGTNGSLLFKRFE